MGWEGGKRFVSGPSLGGGGVVKAILIIGCPGGKRINLNKVLGLTASILITSSGGNLLTCLEGNWKSFLNRVCIRSHNNFNCIGPFQV